LISQPIPKAMRDFLQRCLPQAQADARIDGLAAGGSYITQTLDAFSDLDLVLAVNSEHYESFFNQMSGFLNQMGPLLACFPGTHVGEPRLFVCIYEQDMLHVDFKVIKTEDFATRVEDPVILWEREAKLSKILQKTTPHFPCPGYQWWEDRFWTWVYYLAQKLARGEWFECLDGLAFLRNMVLGPMIQLRHGQQPRGVRYLEKIAPELKPQLLATLATYDPTALKNALFSCCELYQTLRKDAPEPVNPKQGMETAAIQFLNTIQV